MATKKKAPAKKAAPAAKVPAAKNKLKTMGKPKVKMQMPMPGLGGF